MNQSLQISNNEVFTPSECVVDLLDQLPKDVWTENKNFLDPACGDGNMLVEVTKRKLSYGYKPENILKTVYGVEIVKEFVETCKERLLEICGDTETNRDIVDKNIICANFLELRDHDFYAWDDKDKSVFDAFF